jgi:2-polyprenyl-6-methoxyphenol hydroxylase-like FAD-dependent oxidoreductase
MSDQPVAIIGGGPVGFAVAIDLARRGRRSVVIEQDAGTALVLLAKAGFLNERSMELFRRWGIAERVANWGCPDDYPRDTVFCTSLTGQLVGRAPLECARDRIRPESTPEINRKCPQYVLDPMLAEIARETGLVEVRYGTRFEGLNQDAKGVDLVLSDVETGRSSQLRASYVVGCDGATSRVRDALGIPFEGETLDYSVSALVRIEHLERYHPLGRAERFMFIGQNGTWANLTSVDLLSLWRFTMLGSSGKLDLEALDMKADLCRAFGRDDIPFEIVRYVPWKRSQCAAKTLREGRVLLAGDSAHTTSPTGGHGLNTGLGDAAGAGWVIDAMLSGWGGEGLLSAYSRERRAVAIRNSSTSTRNYKFWVGGADYSNVLDEGEVGDAKRREVGEMLDRALYPEWNSYGVAMGYRYDDSPVVVPDGTPATADDDSIYIPTARPGHRAPHGWLEDGRSTLDLFGASFILMRFGGAPDAAPLVAAAEGRSLPLAVFDCRDSKIEALYERKLVLVRPDGHVAWRGDEWPDDVAALVDRVRGAAN